MLNKQDRARNACQLYGAQAKCGYGQLYHRGKLVDEVLAENVGCEYGEYC